MSEGLRSRCGVHIQINACAWACREQILSCLLVYKRIIEGNMANQQGALPDPKATCDPATEDFVDIEFELLDVESDIVAVAAALAERASMTSMREYLLPPELLAVLGPANQLKLLRRHLSRLQNQLTSDSASAPRHHETDQTLREGSGQQTLVASEPASQPATIGESNALASVPVPPRINACAKKP